MLSLNTLEMSGFSSSKAASFPNSTNTKGGEKEVRVEFRSAARYISRRSIWQADVVISSCNCQVRQITDPGCQFFSWSFILLLVAHCKTHTQSSLLFCIRKLTFFLALMKKAECAPLRTDHWILSTGTPQQGSSKKNTKYYLIDNFSSEEGWKLTTPDDTQESGRCWNAWTLSATLTFPNVRTYVFSPYFMHFDSSLDYLQWAMEQESYICSWDLTDAEE